MGQFVKYIGLAHRRQISVADWRSVGINDAESVQWGPENGFSVPIERFTDAQLNKAIRKDSGFAIVGLDEAPDALPHDMTPAQADGPRVDMTGAMDDADVSTDVSEPSEPSSGGRTMVSDDSKSSAKGKR